MSGKKNKSDNSKIKPYLYLKYFLSYDFPWDQTQGLDLNPSPYLNDSVKMYSGHPYLFGFDPVKYLVFLRKYFNEINNQF